MIGNHAAEWRDESVVKNFSPSKNEETGSTYKADVTRTNYGKGQQKGSQTKVSPKPQSTKSVEDQQESGDAHIALKKGTAPQPVPAKGANDETWPTLPKATMKPDQPVKASCNTKAMSKWTASKAGNSLWDDAIFSGEEAETE